MIEQRLARVAIVFLVLGVLSLTGGLAVVALGLTGALAFVAGGHVGDASIVGALAVVVGGVIALGGVPEILTWYGLMGRRSWGRFLGIVMCTALTPLFPFGTLFGGYGLSVLLTDDAARAFGERRSWFVDGAAIALGWMTREGRSTRRDRYASRGYRRRDDTGAAGCGCFSFAALAVLGALLLTGRCDGALREVQATTGATGAWTPSTYDAPTTRMQDAPMQGAPTTPTTPTTGTDTARVAPVVPFVPAVVDDRSAPPRADDGPRSTRGSLWLYEDAAGTTHMVDDLEKVPARFRGSARNP